MKLRNAVKLTALAGFAAMLPATSQALTTDDFGGWSVAAGTITHCPTGAVCKTLVPGDGFLQQSVAHTDGNTYINTIVTDPGVTGPAATLAYSDVSFIIADSAAGKTGVAGQQSINDLDTFFSGTTNLYTGWAGTGVGNMDLGQGSSLTVNQNFTDKGPVGTTALGDSFENTFELAININPTTGVVDGKKMTISQKVGLGDSAVDNTRDMQNFAVMQSSGTQTSAPGSETLGPSGTNPGGTVSWAAGDDLMVVWLGQETTADPTTTPIEMAVFGYERVSNRTKLALTPVPAEAEASAFSTASTDMAVAPLSWDDVSGLGQLFTKPILSMPAD